MRGYRKRPGTQGFSVPLVGAFLFFIISLFCLLLIKTAPSAGEKGNYSLYTANRAFDLDEVYQDGLTAIYAKEYGKTATEAWMRGAGADGASVCPFIIAVFRSGGTRVCDELPAERDGAGEEGADV